jgi:hypothetical protein
MEGTVLLILGGSSGESLARVLEDAGLVCHVARGPLRVRALLESGPIDLVLWAEEPGNAALGEDLRREWERHPHLPVVHLFTNPADAATIQSLSPQVVDSLPVAAPGPLLRLLAGILSALSASHGYAGRNELAFRMVLSQLRERRRVGSADGSAADAREELHAQVTSLSSHERFFLSPSVGSVTEPAPSLTRRSWRWLRDRFAPSTAEEGKNNK